MSVITVRLAKKKSDDGLFEIKDDVPLGKEYQVVLKSREVRKGWNIKHEVEWEKEIIWTENDGWFPTEILENLDGTPL